MNKILENLPNFTLDHCRSGSETSDTLHDEIYGLDAYIQTHLYGTYNDEKSQSSSYYTPESSVDTNTSPNHLRLQVPVVAVVDADIVSYSRQNTRPLYPDEDPPCDDTEIEISFERKDEKKNTEPESVV